MTAEKSGHDGAAVLARSPRFESTLRAIGLGRCAEAFCEANQNPWIPFVALYVMPGLILALREVIQGPLVDKILHATSWVANIPMILAVIAFTITGAAAIGKPVVENFPKLKWGALAALPVFITHIVGIIVLGGELKKLENAVRVSVHPATLTFLQTLLTFMVIFFVLAGLLRTMAPTTPLLKYLAIATFGSLIFQNITTNTAMFTFMELGLSDESKAFGVPCVFRYDAAVGVPTPNCDYQRNLLKLSVIFFILEACSAISSMILTKFKQRIVWGTGFVLNFVALAAQFATIVMHVRYAKALENFPQEVYDFGGFQTMKDFAIYSIVASVIAILLTFATIAKAWQGDSCECHGAVKVLPAPEGKGDKAVAPQDDAV